MKDSSLSDVFTLGKLKDLWDFKSLECVVALIASIVTLVIYGITLFLKCSDSFITELVSVLYDIGFALIGFLGFIVTGLAILTGAISSKVLKRIRDIGKMDNIKRILLSFYLLGLVTAFVIVVSFIIRFIFELPFDGNEVVNGILIVMLTYLTVFIIFYAVKLIGNCLRLFYILNDMELLEDVDRKIDYKSHYNNYRILALESLVLKKCDETALYEYKRQIMEHIESDKISKHDKDIYMGMMKKQFDDDE